MHSELNLSHSNDRSERMESMAPLKLWICLGTITCVLGIVTALSIQGIPSASHAIVAARVAHLELFWARIAFRDPAVHEAEIYLSEAWSNLKERRYEQSVLAARGALERVRDIRSLLALRRPKGQTEEQVGSPPGS
jgi:hypothetical protein